MKKKTFLFILVTISFCFSACSSSSRKEVKNDEQNWQQQLEDQNKIIENLEKQVEDKDAKIADLGKEYLKLSSAKKQQKNKDDEMLEQCFDELLNQSLQVNLLYCQEMDDYPIIRTVTEDNWNLIYDAAIINFTHRQLSTIKISPCFYAKFKYFYYLPTSNHEIDKAATPPKKGWKEISPNVDGDYTIPLTEAGKAEDGCYYTIIKYAIGNEFYYGIIVREPALG